MYSAGLWVSPLKWPKTAWVLKNPTRNISNPETLMGRNPTGSPTNPTRNVPDGLKTLKIGTLAATPL
jgi:hypothetical protein